MRYEFRDLTGTHKVAEVDDTQIVTYSVEAPEGSRSLYPFSELAHVRMNIPWQNHYYMQLWRKDGDNVMIEHHVNGIGGHPELDSSDASAESYCRFIEQFHEQMAASSDYKMKIRFVRGAYWYKVASFWAIVLLFLSALALVPFSVIGFSLVALIILYTHAGSLEIPGRYYPDKLPTDFLPSESLAEG